MGLTEGLGPGTVWKSPADIIRRLSPENPVMAFAPRLLARKARQFIAGFPGLVTYAVKANPDEAVIRTLAAAGLRGFDVASPAEIDLIGRLAPAAARHYHNPVRARAEIRHGLRAGVRVWSVDSHSELGKLFDLLPPDGCEISARFKLPVAGAAYDFGAKFGASPQVAAGLLRAVADHGFIPSLTFHPGTQCTDPQAWAAYITTARDICDAAGVRIHRLNVGGGFPSHREAGPAPDLQAILDLIGRTTAACFGPDAPQLVCEPGRALCADAFALIARVKALRDGADVFLNDGIYGGLLELPLMGNLSRMQVFSPLGVLRQGPPTGRVVFGPTCDSIDRLPGELPLPADLAEGDYIVFHGAGAYSTVTTTRFNGFGLMAHMTVNRLD